MSQLLNAVDAAAELATTCREFGVTSTPGEVKAQYLDLNEQIEAKMDAYVELVESFLPLIDRMQAMLSQRGTTRALMDTVGCPSWRQWLKTFRESFRKRISVRTIQRRLRDYRADPEEEESDANEAVPVEVDVNVVATEVIRAVQKEEASVVPRKEELNPAIREQIIAAWKARVQRDSGNIAATEDGFQPLPIVASGKAHQRLVREQRALLPDPQLAEKKLLAADFTHAEVRQISYDDAKTIILRNEYLGTLGSVSGKYCYGLFFDKFLGSAVCFGSVAGSNVASGVCGKEHADKVAVLVRGASEPWGHEHSASHLIAEACKRMAKDHGKHIIVMYSDPEGGEIGQIYSSVNAKYTGMTGGTEKFKTPDGKIHDGRQISGLTRDRRNGELKYKRTRKQQKQLLLEQGAVFFKGGAKHRYVLISGDGRTKRLLRNALHWEVLPYPKRTLSVKKPSVPSPSTGH